MFYYVSKNHNSLNTIPFQPELINPRLCLNPKYGADIHPKVKAKVLLDSGAFQDREKKQRLSLQGALSRQLNFETRHKFKSELLVSYDRLVDESASAEGRTKKRVSHATGQKYVDETINAAKYLVDERRHLKGRTLVLSCQGVTAPMYLDCLKEILKFASPEDAIGLGGFCIIGQQKQLVKQYYKVLEGALPLLKQKKTRRVHLFGVGYFPVLVRTSFLCRAAGIQASYDTSSYEFNGVMGRVWNPYKLGMSPALLKKDKHTVYNTKAVAELNIRVVTHFWDELNKLPPALPVDDRLKR